MRRSCMPTWTRSSPPSSSGTTPGCGAGRSSSAAGWCWRPATRPRPAGVRGAMGGARARGLCPDAIVVEPRMSAYTKASKDVFEVFREHHPAGRGRLHRRGVPGRRRAAPGLRDARRDRRPAPRARCWTRSACGSPSGWPGRSSWPRWPARWPSRTVCWSSRPGPSWSSCIRCRCSGSGGSGRRAPPSCTSIGIYTVGQVAAHGRGRADLDPRARRPAGTCTRWPTTGTRAGSRSATGGGSIGSQHAMGRARHQPCRHRRRRRRAGRPGDPADARAPTAPDGRSCCGCGSTTSPGSAARAPCSGPPRTPTPSWRTVRGLVAAAMPMIESTGPHPGRHRGRQPGRRRAPCSSNCPSTNERPLGGARTPRWTASGTGSARPPSPGPCCSGATRASTMPVLPD